MNLSEELAHTCVKRAQPELEDAREQFEGLAQREEVLRRHAERMHDLAQERALREDTSIPGYMATGLERLTPVPHTGTEALIRTPLIGAAGLAGYLAGKEFEAPDVADITRVLRPTDKKLEAAGERAMGLATRDVPYRTKRLKQLLHSADPETLAGALRKRPLPIGGAGESALRSEIAEMGDVGRLRKELANVARQTAPKEGILPKLKPWRLGGGLAGLLAGSALTGLPLAIRALWLKQQGGEAAARAEAAAREAIEEATGAQASREDILKVLEGEA